MLISAVLNPGADGVNLAVLRDHQVVHRARADMYGRDAAELPLFVERELQKVSLRIEDVSRWSVGSGPGSFTALRMTAALVGGWCFGKSGACRSVPGAIALGAALPGGQDGEKIGALYDGRNREVLYFGLIYADGELVPTGETQVLDAQGAAEFFASRPTEKLVVSAVEVEAVKKIIPAELPVTIVEAADYAALDRNRTIAFDDDLTRLVYIRPAVYGRED